MNNLNQDEYNIVLSYLYPNQQTKLLTLTKNVYVCYEMRLMVNRKNVLDFYYESYKHILELRKLNITKEMISQYLLNLDENEKRHIEITFYFGYTIDETMHYENRVYKKERHLAKNEKIINMYFALTYDFPDLPFPNTIPVQNLNDVHFNSLEGIQNFARLKIWMNYIQDNAVYACYGCSGVCDPVALFCFSCVWFEGAE